MQSERGSDYGKNLVRERSKSKAMEALWRRMPERAGDMYTLARLFSRSSSRRLRLARYNTPFARLRMEHGVGFLRPDTFENNNTIHLHAQQCLSFASRTILVDCRAGISMSQCDGEATRQRSGRTGSIWNEIHIHSTPRMSLSQPDMYSHRTWKQAS